MIRELIGYAGLAMIVAGVALWSRPAALILAGVMVVIVAVFGMPEHKKTEG